MSTWIDEDTTGYADEIIAIAKRAIAVYESRKPDLDLRENVFRDILTMAETINRVQDAGNVRFAQLFDGVQFALINKSVYAKTDKKAPDWMLEHSILGFHD